MTRGSTPSSLPSRRLPFVKMHGAGNDYVFVDGFATAIDETTAAALAASLSDRHRGIGGDGLILLMPSHDADCRMVMWNADGSRGAMCGNGIRCLAKLAADHGRVAGDRLRVETDSGIRAVTVTRDAAGSVVGARVAMGPVEVDAEPARIVVGGTAWPYHRCRAGNEHAVVFVDADPDAVPVESLGPAFQRDAAFPDGVNVEVVRVEVAGLRQRTWERGSGETLACGSGATAAAIAAIRTGRLSGPRVTVTLRGGELEVEDAADGAVLAGPAATVFRGEFELR